jgi:hypothetical protein
VLDVNDPADRHILPLRWLADVHRQSPREDDEHLVLERMPMAAPFRAGLVAPDVRADL